jgi:DNA primase large subunit
VQELDHRITELDSQEYVKITEIAEQRINEAIDKKQVSYPLTSNFEIELLSFPIAMMMVTSSNDQSLKKRYALAESKRVYGLLKRENRQMLVAISQLFNWKIRPVEIYIERLQAKIPGFSLDFMSYLKNSTVFHESKWKLVNRNMLCGGVFLTNDETARLLSEEVRVNIEKKLDPKMDIGLPLSLVNKVEKLRQLYSELRKTREEEMPKEVNVDAFPPCINRLYKTALEKQHLSHIERFTLTSFLLNSGMTIEKVIECFRPTSDFSEKMTRYQVEHIAGGKGSRTKYTPPMCTTLRTHRICPGGDEICTRIWHPLNYYRTKFKMIENQTQGQEVKK